MSADTKILVINGSPKSVSQSVSGTLALQAQNLFNAAGLESSVIRAGSAINDSALEANFAAMRAADALLFIFPLYYFCVPSKLMRFMEDYAAHVAREGGLPRSQHVYAIVNCGFPEPDINEEAIRVVRSFAGHIGASFRFGVSSGAGGMITEAKDAPFMKKAAALLDNALSQMAQDTLVPMPVPPENMSISPNFPRRLYFFMGNRGWYSMSRKNKLNKKDLYARPYQPV